MSKLVANLIYLFAADNRGQIPRNSEVQEICGILGIIHLMAGNVFLFYFHWSNCFLNFGSEI